MINQNEKRKRKYVHKQLQAMKMESLRNVVAYNKNKKNKNTQ